MPKKKLLFSVALLLLFPVSLAARCQEFVRVESASFERGADVAKGVFDSGREPHYGPDWDEGPKHKVAVSEFRIATKQVSMSEFARFMPEYKQRIEIGKMSWAENSPAVLVSWHEANAYCQWIEKETGTSCQLPTESEWELAASQATALKLKGIGDGVQEWCRDWWAPYPQQARNLKDPTGASNGILKVHRDGGGGSVEEEKKDGESVADFRITDRSATVPEDRRSNLGFRIVQGRLPKVDEAHFDLEYLAAPFVDVDQRLKDWDAIQNAAAYFSAGGKFIDAGKDDLGTLPYWNRHHVPSLTWCDNGDLLATAFTAAFDNSDQMAILITRLRTGADKWDPPAIFFNAPDHNVTSAVLFNAGGGVIHHYNGLGSSRCEDFSMIKRVSRDNGATWSKPKIVHRFPVNAASPKNPFGSPRLWPHMDLKVCELEGKRVLLMSTDVGAGNELGSAIFVSEDEGDSWNEQTRTGWQAENFAKKGKAAGWIAGIHAPVERLKDGSLIAIGRSNNIEGFAPLSRSTDFGKSWTYSASPFPPILSAQRSVLMRLREGPLLFIGFTDSSTSVRAKTARGIPFGDAKGGSHLGIGTFAAISYDDGKTWSNRKLIPNWFKKPWKSRTSGYLSCVQTPDGLIHLVSSSHYYRFNLAWLKEPMPVP